ncbi:TPA: helix-turn-helix domain-containing protein [Legionella pneumophila]|uniref:helix-turn-helix domain-containing protein n=1 Tax=Legionella pneumophila TaxID=446 RepID=UPI001C196BA1|nr:helix-turn-helix domain-containing protein [Legionella pneumophila]
MIKKNSPEKLGNPPRNCHQYNNSTLNQQSRMLIAFKENPRISTFAFHSMGIVSPAARIKDLRTQHSIATEWINEADQNGVIHKIALYVYLGTNNQEVN